MHLPNKYQAVDKCLTLTLQGPDGSLKGDFQASVKQVVSTYGKEVYLALEIVGGEHEIRWYLFWQEYSDVL